MPWNLMLLPLLGGFLFLHNTYWFKFRNQRTEGHRLLITSAVWGVGLAAVARLLTILVASSPIGATCQALLSRVAPFPFAGVAFGAFFLGLALPIGINYFIPEEKAKEKAFEFIGDDLLALLYRAAKAGQPIFLTLENRKIYVGFVLEAPNLERVEKTSVRLLPIWSGYRESETLKTQFTVFYDDVYLAGNIDLSDFAVALPVARISSAHLFDLDIYKQHFAQQVNARPADSDDDLSSKSGA